MVPLNRQLIQSHYENFSGKPTSKLTGNWNNQEQIWELKQFKLCTLKGKQVEFLTAYQTQGDGCSPEREEKATLMLSLWITSYDWLQSVKGEPRSSASGHGCRNLAISPRDGTNFPTERLVLSLCPSNINNSIFFNQIDKISPLLPPDFPISKQPNILIEDTVLLWNVLGHRHGFSIYYQVNSI